MNSWNKVEDVMPTPRIRVIAADHLIVLGDCFWGHSSPSFWDEEFKIRRERKNWQDECWRHSLTEQKVKHEVTYWQELPILPKCECHKIYPYDHEN